MAGKPLIEFSLHGRFPLPALLRFDLRAGLAGAGRALKGLLRLRAAPDPDRLPTPAAHLILIVGQAVLAYLFCNQARLDNVAKRDKVGDPLQVRTVLIHGPIARCQFNFFRILG
ncbi:hypothetical protein D3C76_1134120 [compost metagenome]